MRYALSLVLSPRTVRKPPKESSSGSVAFSLARTPISVLAEPADIRSCVSHVPGGEDLCLKVVRIRDCDIAS